MSNEKVTTHKDFVHEIDDEVVLIGTTEKTFCIIGRAQFKGIKENKYLIQEVTEEFDYNFGKGIWTEENKTLKWSDEPIETEGI